MDAHDGGSRPQQSIWPVGIAVGIAALLVGLVISWWLVAAGGGLTLAFLVGWLMDSARQARRTAGAAPAVEPAEAEEPQEVYTRSAFLTASTLAVGGVVGAGIAVPVVGFSIVGPFLHVKKYETDLGPITDYPENKWFTTTFMLDPKEGDVTRRTAFIRNNGLSDSVPSFTIISNRCVHLGCPVQPNGPEISKAQTARDAKTGQEITKVGILPAGGFGCPCHGGQYDAEGNRTAGPPVRALDRYDYAIRGGHLILGKPYSVGHVNGTGAQAEIRKYTLAGPGQHIDGWEEFLYPLQPPHN